MNARALQILTTATACSLLAASISAELRAQAPAGAEATAPERADDEQTKAPRSMEDDVRPTPEDLLADAGIRTTIPAMTATLQDRELDGRLRGAAAIALARSGDVAVIPILLGALDDPDDDVRASAISALARLPDAHSVPHLRAILDDTSTRGRDGGQGARILAVGALGAIHTEDAAAVVLRTAIDPREQVHVRYNALSNLGDMGVASVTVHLRPLLFEPEPELRLGAAATMGRLGDRSAIPTLVNGIVEGASYDYLEEAALIGLEHVTGTSFGRRDQYGGIAGPDDFDEIARRVEDWWRSNRRYYE